MPVELRLSHAPIAVGGLDNQLPPAKFDPRITVDLEMRDVLGSLGLTTPEAFLAMSGEIISGHPDRHVMRVVLANGRAGYLKREHRIRWRDRFCNWRAGYGWVSKSVREGCTLQYFESWGFPGPRWLAFGEDGQGRAFLLVEEVAGARELRRVLRDAENPRELAARLGHFCAELHANGFDHPDLYAKHFLVDPARGEITLLDWQRTEKRVDLGWDRRARALAALLATIPDSPSPLLDRSQFSAEFLLAYIAGTGINQTQEVPNGPDFAQQIQKEMKRLERRRGIREQRQAPLAHTAQRLVWLDGESLCAIPEVVPDLRWAAVQMLLYDQSRNGFEMFLSGERKATLHVGTNRLSLTRLWSWLRGKSWRSPQLRLARLLFHLERHHIVAPKLFAFGQRFQGTRCDGFVLSESPPTDAVSLTCALQQANHESRAELLSQFAAMLHQLHEAGCEAVSAERFAFSDGMLRVIDPAGLRFRRYLSIRRRKNDLRRCFQSIKAYCETHELERILRVAAEQR